LQTKTKKLHNEKGKAVVSRKMQFPWGRYQSLRELSLPEFVDSGIWYPPANAGHTRIIFIDGYDGFSFTCYLES